MAIKIPRYDSPTVETNALPTPHMTGASPEVFGAGLARGMNDLAEVVQKEREKEELTAFNDAKLDMETFASELIDGKTDATGKVQGGLLTRKGAAAKGLEQEAKPQWEKRYNENIERLKSYPAAAQLFGQWNKSRWTKTAVDINKHEMAERTVTAIASQSSVIERQGEAIIAAVGKGEKFDFTELGGSIKTLAELKGYDPETTKVLLEDTKSNVMAMAVQQLMNSGNDEQINRAIAIFDEHKGEMDPAQRAKLEPHVIQMQQLVAGEAKANEIWEKVGPKGLNDPINFVEMEKVLKGIPDRNEREFAERELNQRAAKWNRTQSEYRQANVAAVYGKIMQGQSMKSIMSSKEFQSLPVDAQFSLKNTIESEYKIGSGGGVGGSRGGGGGRSGGSSTIARDMAYEEIVDRVDSGTLPLTNWQDAYKFADVLGPANTRKLVSHIKRNEKAAKTLPGGVSEFRRVFKDTLRELRENGIDAPDPDSRKEKASLARNELYSKVHDAVLTQQMYKGKQLTTEEVERTMRKMVSPAKVRGTQYFMGIPVYKTEFTKPRYQVKNPGALSRSTIMADLAEMLGRTPTKGEVDRAEQALKGRGR